MAGLAMFVISNCHLLRLDCNRIEIPDGSKTTIMEVDDQRVRTNLCRAAGLAVSPEQGFY